MPAAKTDDSSIGLCRYYCAPSWPVAARHMRLIPAAADRFFMGQQMGPLVSRAGLAGGGAQPKTNTRRR
jgi:hypothetical protein